MVSWDEWDGLGAINGDILFIVFFLFFRRLRRIYRYLLNWDTSLVQMHHLVDCVNLDALTCQTPSITTYLELESHTAVKPESAATYSVPVPVIILSCLHSARN